MDSPSAFLVFPNVDDPYPTIKEESMTIAEDLPQTSSSNLSREFCTELCAICGCQAKGLHFGVYSCYAW